MGEKERGPFQFRFNGFLKVAFQGSRVTSDADLIPVRELDERLGLETLIAEHLSHSRPGSTGSSGHPISCGSRSTGVYRRLAGHEDLTDAARLAAGPTFRVIGSPIGNVG